MVVAVSLWVWCWYWLGVEVVVVLGRWSWWVLGSDGSGGRCGGGCGGWIGCVSMEADPCASSLSSLTLQAISSI